MLRLLHDYLIDSKYYKKIMTHYSEWLAKPKRPKRKLNPEAQQRKDKIIKNVVRRPGSHPDRNTRREITQIIKNLETPKTNS